MNVKSVLSSERLLGLVLCAIATSALLSGCGDKKESKPASQTAAKVNKEEITVHQINAVLQQQRGLRPDQADAASKAVLERLIEQELAVQKAGELKLDRDARVVQQIDAARREIIARAYLQKIGDGASKPTPEEVKRYYEENPNLFSARRVYQLQEIVIEASSAQVAEFGTRLKAAKNIGEFIEYLRAQQLKFTTNQGVRGAEQLPMSSLATFAAMKDGDTRVTMTPTGAQVLALINSRNQPVDLERARPAIETFLVNERKRKIIADDLKAMRAAASIQYVGKFADAASAASATQAPAPAASVAEPVLEAASSPASGAIDVTTITKGLGLK